MQITTVGLDVAKQVFQVHGVDAHGKELDRQVTELEQQITRWHKSSEQSRKLEKVPGIGPLTASALVATIGDATAFQHGRQLAA